MNGGATWSNLDPNGNLPGRAVNSLAFDPTNANTVYAALGGFNTGTLIPGHLFKTGNAQSAAPAWPDVSPGADLPFNVVAVDPANPSSIYVGTDAAVWHSSNGGGGWQFLGPATGLPNVPVYDLKINPATDQVAAFTFGRGAWTLDPNGTPPSGPLPALPANTALQATLGSSYSVSLNPGGNSTYSYALAAGALPLGMVLSASGTIMGTPLSPGVSTFTIVVTNGSGGMASQTITLTVGTAGTAPVWSSIGPSPNAYVQAPSNPSNFNSGRVSSIAVDPSDATHWLVGYGNGGIWETHNSGASWRPIADSAPTLAIGAIAFAPSNPAIIYAGTGEADYSGFTKAGLGMLKSTDGGATWPVVATTNFVQASVKRIRVNPSNPNNVLAITSMGGVGRESVFAPSPPLLGVLRSTDGGVNWSLTLTGQASALEIHPTNFNNQYAAIGDPFLGPKDIPGKVANGVYRSTDGGQTWSLVPGPWGAATTSSPPFGWIELAISPSSPNTLYASFSAPGSTGALFGLYRTDNAWDPTPTWTQIPSVGDGGYCGPTKCPYSNVISVDPSDPGTLFAFGGQNTANAGDIDEGDGAFRCSNCGSTPTWTYIPGPHTDHHAIAWAGKRLIDGNDGGMWSTADSGNTWLDLNASISTNMFFSGALHATNPDFILGGLRDFQISTFGGGRTWSIFQQVGSVEWGEAEVAMSSTNPDTDWMAAWIWGVINRTTDGGQTRLEVDAGIDNTASAFVAPVRKCPSNDNVFLTGTNRIWRTNNFFNSAMPAWAANSPFGSPNTQGSPATILSIAYAPTDTTCNTYAFGTLGGQIQLTRDGGNTWANLDPNQKLPARALNGLAFDPTNANTLYLGFSSFNSATPGTSGHVFKTTSALAAAPAFIDISPPQDQPFNVIAVDPVNPPIVYAGSDIGLWRSNDGGATWLNQGPALGMPIAPVYDIKINPPTGRTVVFTYGRGAFALGPELVSGASSPANGATYIAGGLVPGSWAQVQGRNLAGVSRIWGGADFAPLSNTLPANLSGVGVTVNGVPAAVYYISPTQVSFQVPDGITGTATVQVVRDGVPSNTITGTAVSTSPGIFPVIVNGTNYAAAVFLDGSLAGDPSIGPGFRNAHPGDVVQLYATGLEPSPAGVPVSVQSVSGVTVTIGSVTFPADAAALVGPGEFQVNFTVPQQFATLADGNYPISIQVNGASSPQTINSSPPGQLVLPIQH
ncbi:MAG: putative Ig domain-containing protein [Bryobacteraceae bacterium]